jgi:hypothetical protein
MSRGSDDRDAGCHGFEDLRHGLERKDEESEKRQRNALIRGLD